MALLTLNIGTRHITSALFWGGTASQEYLTVPIAATHGIAEGAVEYDFQLLWKACCRALSRALSQKFLPALAVVGATITPYQEQRQEQRGEILNEKR